MDTWQNIDLFLIVFVSLVAMAVLSAAYVKKRTGTFSLIAAWVVLVLILGIGFTRVRNLEFVKQQEWFEYLCGQTLSYADSTQRLGHHLILPLESEQIAPSPDVPKQVSDVEATVKERGRKCRNPEIYETITNMHADWCRDVNIVGYVFTLRLIGDKQVEFICSCPTDINRDGVIEGELEVGDPPFTPYREGDDFAWYDVYEAGFRGETTLDANVNSDDYGDWITAVSPLRRPDGSIEAILGVDFRVDKWVSHTRENRSAAIWLWCSVLALYFTGTTGFAYMRRSLVRTQELNERLLQTQEELERTVKSKGEFLANMSHEIRTPMNAILGMIHLVRETGLSEKQIHFIENAEQSAKLLLRVINDILDFSKIEAGHMDIEKAPLSIRQTVGDIYRLIGESARKNGIEPVFSIAEDVPEIVIGDSVRLSQILVNLLGNAIKFSPNGRIDLQVEVRKKEEESITLGFKVHDTGIGMEEKQVRTIFQAFTQADSSTTRKFGGTGLGLAICRSLVELMHGKIGCRSTPGQGSTFFFTAVFELPDDIDVKSSQIIAPKNEAQFDRESIVSIPEKIRNTRILLAEDNKINQLVATELLTMKGFEVDIANTGKEVLERLEQRKYGLILMDIQMPEMDGLEATRQIRRNPQYANLPILAMTAHAMTGDHELSLEAGMNDHITKPIDPSVLFHAIVKWLRSEDQATSG